MFGVNCSPFILSAVKSHHLDNHLPELGDTVRTLKDSFYVDNCVTSVSSETELNKFE